MNKFTDKLNKIKKKFCKISKAVVFIIPKLLKKFLTLFWHYSGLEFVFYKFFPKRDSGKLPTGPIWIIGIYFAAYGVASQKYENRVDVIENRASSAIAMLANEGTRKRAFRNIPEIQNMECPMKPDVLNPILTIKLLFGVSDKHQETIELLKKIVEDLKNDLAGAYLNYGIFDDVDFGGANLEGAYLAYASLKNANLIRANLKKATLVNANLQEAYLGLSNLEEANFETADLRGAHFAGPLDILEKVSDGIYKGKIRGTNAKNSYFYGADFGCVGYFCADLTGVDLTGANLIKAKIKPHQVCATSSIAGCKMDKQLESQVKNKCPKFFSNKIKGAYTNLQYLTKPPE